MVAVSDLKRELENLQYRERKKLAIQGNITAVRYTRHPNTVEEGGEVGGVSFETVFNNGDK